MATRGEQRFAAVTYSQIALWTGLKLSTVQSYGAKGCIPKNDMVPLLQWVAKQCAANRRPAPWERERLNRPANRLARQLGFWCYKDYIKSELWQNIRKQILPADCVKCGQPANQVHHRKYTLENMQGECFKWLIPVCQGCHRRIHRSQEDDNLSAEPSNSAETAPKRAAPTISRAADGSLRLTTTPPDANATPSGQGRLTIPGVNLRAKPIISREPDGSVRIVCPPEAPERHETHDQPNGSETPPKHPIAAPAQPGSG